MCWLTRVSKYRKIQNSSSSSEQLVRTMLNNYWMLRLKDFFVRLHDLMTAWFASDNYSTGVNCRH